MPRLFVTIVVAALLAPLTACKPGGTPGSEVKDAATGAAAAVPDLWSDAYEVLRVQADWDEPSKTWSVRSTIEKTGTAGLKRASSHPDGLGSFRGILLDEAGKEIGHGSVGIGSSYRDLARAVSFRFPKPTGPVTFKLVAESPTTGRMTIVVEKKLDVAAATVAPDGQAEAKQGAIEVRTLRAATKSPKVLVNVYSEGYLEAARGTFWADTKKVVDGLAGYPGGERFEIRGVFGASKRDFAQIPKNAASLKADATFIGLNFPFWFASQFDRWGMIVYPRDEQYFRSQVGLVPYDYPIALINSAEYFGMGNYKLITAIPAHHPQFTYLLHHELGHYFGLNEEYDSGSTELLFTASIKEPWSPNITLETSKAKLKWKVGGQVNLYPGGYGGDRMDGRQVYKPVAACMMGSGGPFCPVCSGAIDALVSFDAGARDEPVAPLDATPPDALGTAAVETGSGVTPGGASGAADPSTSSANLVVNGQPELSGCYTVTTSPSSYRLTLKNSTFYQAVLKPGTGGWMVEPGQNPYYARTAGGFIEISTPQLPIGRIKIGAKGC